MTVEASVVTDVGPPAAIDEGRREERAALVAEVAGQVGSTAEAGWILEHVEHEGGAAAPTVRTAALSLARRRAAGEPLQYVLGTWAFRCLELRVDRRVLIPRPETEQVVEVALGELTRIAAARRASGSGEDRPLICVDLGTGSGAIALSLAVEGVAGGLPVEVWACDASSVALEVARANLADLAGTDAAGAERVTMAEGSWFRALPEHLARSVDLVVSNPPYVSEDEYGDLEPVVRDWEPRQALVARRGRNGVAGMADIEKVVAGAGAWLRPAGGLVVELAPSQAYGAIDAARRAGFTRVGTSRDLAGRLRMLVAER
jgi:release factor glutamine methyltransferase